MNEPIDYDRIRRIAFRRGRMLRGAASIDWEDLAQEAVLAALRGRKSIHGPMYDLARQQGMIGRHRSHHANFQRVDPDVLGLLPAAEASGFTILARVEGALASLPPPLQVILRLLYWEGASQQEAASQVGITQGRVSQLHSEAIRLVRKRLAQKAIQ